MFISKPFSSAIVYSACSAALLTLVGCSDAGSDKVDPSAQSQNQVTAAQTQTSAPSTSNTTNTQEFSGTTRGRVSAVNADGSVQVLGQTIAVSNATMYFGVTRSDIMVGDYISVDGSIDGSGRVVAGAITLDTSFDTTVSLMGVVTNVNNNDQTFQVGDITVGFDAINFSNFDGANLTTGMVVEIAADEEDFEAGTDITQITGNSISVLGNGSIINIGENGVFVSDGGDTAIVNNNGVQVSDGDENVVVNGNGVLVSDSDGTVVVLENGVFIDDSGDAIIVGQNGVSVTDDGAVVDANGLSVNVDGNAVVVGEGGVSVNVDGTVSVGATGVSVTSNGESVVIDQNGVIIIDGNGETSVTSDGITIDGVDLQNMINDTVNETLNELLDLGDLNTYDYSDIALSSSTNCLSIGAPATFQITGNTTNAMSEQVKHNLSGQVSIASDSPGNLSVVANDSTGIYLNMNEQNIVEMDIIAGDTKLTHFVGAIPSTVERPVVLTKQTANWCSFIVFEQDKCTSITNTSSATVNVGQAMVETSPTGTSITAGQTVVDTSSAGTNITVDGQTMIDIPSNQWVSENGNTESVSSHSGLTVSGCTLSNPENIPVITVD